MKNFVPLIGVGLLVACLLCGCRTAPPPPANLDLARTMRNNCYSLLHQLLDEQKDISLLRFIKREDSDVKILMKRIASASGAGAKLLEEYAKKDPMLFLGDIRLPPAEVATREAIAASKKKELLGQKGDEFELTLLLTQTEALSYARHLAQVASANESQPERATALAGLSAEMERLHREVVALLQLTASRRR